MASQPSQKPRIGIPYRTRKEELSGERSKYNWYGEAVRLAGGEPVEISLGLAHDQLQAQAERWTRWCFRAARQTLNPRATMLRGTLKAPRAIPTAREQMRRCSQCVR